MKNRKYLNLLYGLLLLIAAASWITGGCGGGGGGSAPLHVKTSTPAPVVPQEDIVVSYATFTLILLPDSQYAVEDYPQVLTSQAQWIVDHKAEKNIVYALHEGDITNNHSVTQFQRASDSLWVLEDKVPLALAVGNHDMGSSRDTTNCNAAFPVSRFQKMSTFGGVYQSDKIENTYHLFTAGGTDWIIIVLEFSPRDETLDWANQIADTYSNRRAIILTHDFVAPSGVRSSTGENIWQKFAKKHKNISFVFNGHWFDPDAARLTSTGDNGNTVYQMLADYQDKPFGGTGLLRIVEFDRNNSKVYVKTFSATSNFYMSDADNQFELTGVELGPP